MPMDEKQLKKLIDEVKAVGDRGEDMATSQELRNLEEAIKAETEELKADSAYNKKINDKNEKLNLAQAAFAGIVRMRDKRAQDNQQKSLDQQAAEQLKRDQGGKAVRTIILEQNKLTLESLNRIENILGKGGGPGGGGTGGGGGGSSLIFLHLV